MPRKSRLRLVRSQGNLPEPISALSTEEQRHLLDLADVALHNADRVRQDHEQLTEELKNTVERFEKNRSELKRKGTT